MAASLASLHPDVCLTVIDANAEKLYPNEVLRRIDCAFDEIVIKATAPSIRYDILLAKAIKEKYPATKVVLSGQVAGILQKWLRLNCKGIDSTTEPLDDYIYKRIYNKSERIPLDLFPSPDFRLFPYQRYVDYPDRDISTPVLRGTLLTSRGCAMGCGYCPYTMYYKSKVEFRSIDKVIKDIRGLLDLGITTIQFRDQYFTANHEHVKQLCNAIINEKLHFSWKCETRLESLNPELIDLMVAAGCKIIFIGIESASDNTLNSFNRSYSISKEQMEFLIGYMNSKGLITGGFYIIGFPDDTWESIEATINYAITLRTSFAKFSLFSSYPNQKLWHERYSHIPVTPELFSEFENTLTVNVSEHLSMDELRYAEVMATNSFYRAINGLGLAYRAFYAEQRNFYKSIANVKNTLAMLPIGEFKGTTINSTADVVTLTVVGKKSPLVREVAAFS
jgi:radical SAM superfamily enzyme YgiQ (UPF0313 family)